MPDPIKHLLAEHGDILAQFAELEPAVAQIHEVDHPKIEANGEQLRQLANNGGSAASLMATSQEIWELVKMHFEKEEQILFPMANQLFDSQTLVDIATKIRMIDSE